MADQLNAPAKPVKQKPGKQSVFDYRYWYVLVAVLFGSAFASVVIGNAVWATGRVIESAANVSIQAMAGFGQLISVMTASTLVGGESEQRIELLNQLAEAEVGNSCMDFLMDAVELNLSHENEVVRLAAERVWERIKGLERIKTNITIADGQVFQDGEAIPMPESSPATE